MRKCWDYKEFWCWHGICFYGGAHGASGSGGAGKSRKALDGMGKKAYNFTIDEGVSRSRYEVCAFTQDSSLVETTKFNEVRKVMRERQRHCYAFGVLPHAFHLKALVGLYGGSMQQQGGTPFFVPERNTNDDS